MKPQVLGLVHDAHPSRADRLQELVCPPEDPSLDGRARDRQTLGYGFCSSSVVGKRKLGHSDALLQEECLGLELAETPDAKSSRLDQTRRNAHRARGSQQTQPCPA